MQHRSPPSVVDSICTTDSPLAASGPRTASRTLAKLANFEPVREADAGPSNGVHVTINLDHARIHPQTITIDKVIDAQAVEVAPELPAKVTSPGAAPTASAPLTTAHEHSASLNAFRPSQQATSITWPGSAK